MTSAKWFSVGCFSTDIATLLRYFVWSIGPMPASGFSHAFLPVVRSYATTLQPLAMGLKSATYSTSPRTTTGVPVWPITVTFGLSFLWKVNSPSPNSFAANSAVSPAFFAAATELSAPLWSASKANSRALIAGFQSAMTAGGTGAAARMNARNMGNSAEREITNLSLKRNRRPVRLAFGGACYEIWDSRSGGGFDADAERVPALLDERVGAAGADLIGLQFGYLQRPDPHRGLAL